MSCKFCEYIEGDPCRISWEAGADVRCIKCQKVLPAMAGIECVSGGISEAAGGQHVFFFRSPFVCNCENPIKQIVIPCRDLIIDLGFMIDNARYEERILNVLEG